MKVSDARRQVNDCEKEIVKEYRTLINCVDEVGRNAYAAAVDRKKKGRNMWLILVAALAIVLSIASQTMFFIILGLIIEVVVFISGKNDQMLDDLQRKRKTLNEAIDRLRVK